MPACSLLPAYGGWQRISAGLQGGRLQGIEWWRKIWFSEQRLDGVAPQKHRKIQKHFKLKRTQRVPYALSNAHRMPHLAIGKSTDCSSKGKSRQDSAGYMGQLGTSSEGIGTSGQSLRTARQAYSDVYLSVLWNIPHRARNGREIVESRWLKETTPNLFALSIVPHPRASPLTFILASGSTSFRRLQLHDGGRVWLRVIRKSIRPIFPENSIWASHLVLRLESHDVKGGALSACVYDTGIVRLLTLQY
ncbi:hypothetical protein BDZ91DRAFT_763771 [Kalaharituber pfeilii]|nr:hypothetical protein BDZ91DRAFT_763771 [Kalaharituber pfeilii]